MSWFISNIDWTIVVSFIVAMSIYKIIPDMCGLVGCMCWAVARSLKRKVARLLKRKAVRR